MSPKSCEREKRCTNAVEWNEPWRFFLSVSGASYTGTIPWLCGVMLLSSNCLGLPTTAAVRVHRRKVIQRCKTARLKSFVSFLWWLDKNSFYEVEPSAFHACYRWLLIPRDMNRSFRHWAAGFRCVCFVTELGLYYSRGLQLKGHSGPLFDLPRRGGPQTTKINTKSYTDLHK